MVYSTNDFPGTLSRRLGFLLAQAHLAARARADTALARLGLNAKAFGALAAVVGDGPISQQTLSRRIRVDPATIVDVIDELEASGHIVRTRNPRDRREYALQATPRGKALYRRADRALAQAERETIGGLGAAEARALRDLLLRMLTP